MTPFRRNCALGGLLIMFGSYLCLAIAAQPWGWPLAQWWIVETLIVLALAGVVLALILGIIGFRYVTGWIAIIGAVFWPLAYYSVRFL
jgi:hypothetical protein